MRQVCATWDGSQAAERKDVAWVAALNNSSSDPQPQPRSHLPIISHDDFMRAQREDQAISPILSLRSKHTEVTDEICKTVNGATQKHLHEWSMLSPEDDVLYPQTQARSSPC